MILGVDYFFGEHCLEDALPAVDYHIVEAAGAVHDVGVGPAVLLRCELAGVADVLPAVVAGGVAQGTLVFGLTLSVLAELVGRANQAIAFIFSMEALTSLVRCLAPSVALKARFESDAQTTHLEPGGVELFLACGALKRFLLLFLCHPLLVSAIHCAVLL